MQAAVGDRLHVHANVVGHPGRTGEIVEVRGAGGEPPYLVRFDDGHTALVFPGPDAIIEHPRRKAQEGAGERLAPRPAAISAGTRRLRDCAALTDARQGRRQLLAGAA